MKKVFLSIISVIGALFGIIIILGFVAPKEFRVEREITINKPKAVVFSHLKSLENANKWQPFAKRDPNIQISYRGTDGSVGAVSAWNGNGDVGAGEQEIKNIVENERIDIELRFKKPFEDSSNVYFVTEAMNDGSTKVRWGMEGKSKFPFNVMCMLMGGVEKMLTKDFDEGLSTLKKTLE
jgi:hypothetical protein